MVTFLPPDTGGDMEPSELRRRRPDADGQDPDATTAVTSTAINNTAASRAKVGGSSLPSSTVAEAAPPPKAGDEHVNADVDSVDSEHGSIPADDKPTDEKADGHSSPNRDKLEDDDHDPFPDMRREKIRTITSETEPIAQPRFSRIKLSPKYDGLDLETRLWLQSRSLNAQVPDMMLIPEHYKVPSRSLTWNNICISFELLCILLPVGWAFFRSHPELLIRFLIFILGKLTGGWISTLELIASSSLLGLIDLSVQGIHVSANEAIWAGAYSVALHLIGPIQLAVFGENSRVLNEKITKLVTRASLAMSLSQTITESHDPLRVALLQEASAFGKNGSTVNTLGSAMHTISTLVSHAFVLNRVLKKGGRIFSAANGFVLAMTLGPVIIRRLNMMWRDWRAMGRRDWHRDRNHLFNRRHTMRSLAVSLVHKPEVLIYRLQDWIMGEYDEADRKILDQNDDKRLEEKAADVVDIALRRFIDAVFHVLIVTRKAPVSLSLASMNLLSKTMAKSFNHMGRLHELLKSIVNEVFNAAAFHICHTYSGEHKGPQINYDAHRQPDGGMELELRNVTFTYPEADKAKPSLKRVNLRIAPGETVAVVGMNGSGKSTLLKVLLGLYDGHQGLEGDVLVNGIRMADYDMKTVYSRVAVVMQDFQRYDLTLRENVGVGSIQCMKDRDRMKRALVRGGAKELADNVGLEMALSPWGVSRVGDGSLPFNPDAAKKKKAAVKNANGRARNKDGTTNGQVADSPSKVSEIDDTKAAKDGGVEASEKGEALDPMECDPPEEGDEGGGNGDGGKGVSLPWKIVLRIGRFWAAFVASPGARKRLLHMQIAAKEKRTSLSGGQWQRVALARAFMGTQGADMVMFDEPSSNLDPEAEADLFKTLHSLSQSNGGHSVTTLYVSHRMQTTRRAQRILLLEHGEIIEDGTHDELMARQGRYYDLYSVQRDGFQ